MKRFAEHHFTESKKSRKEAVDIVPFAQYHKNVIPKEECDNYYNYFKDNVDKEQKVLHFFGEKKEPRFTAFYSSYDHNYKYSGITMESKGWPEQVSRLVELGETITGFKCNSVLVNYYPDGSYYVSRHRDKDAMQGDILSFSFGDSRTFRIRDNKGKIVKDVDLESGSLFVMKEGFQSEYMHEIVPTKKPKGGRINLTLRKH
jgi:alkylated DNA repair dioxygenase AlkB